MSDQEELKSERRAYSKPELRRVQLSPEESLSTGCKITTQPAPGGPNTCTTGSCFEPGS